MGMSTERIGKGFMGEAIGDSRLSAGRVGTSGILGDPQPAFDPVEEGEELPEERSKTKGREDTANIEDA